MTRRLPAVSAALAALLAVAVAGAGAAPSARAAETGPAATTPAPAPGSAPGPANDLREFRVGMTVHDLPAHGYLDFSCDAKPGQSLAGWDAYASCPADAHGLHDVDFKYDDAYNPRARLNSALGGTKVAGHPVVLTLMIDDHGVVQGLRIATDPHVPPYLHKKAFLFRDQVRQQFGSDGWTCTTGHPTGDEEPIADIFIKQHCEKVTPTRHLYLDTSLYQHPGAHALKDMINGTELTIMLRHPG